MINKTIDLSSDGKAKLSILGLELKESYNDWQNKEKPGILIIPGGSYRYNSVREAYPIALNYIKEGYQTFILNYHVREESEFPRPLKDAALAVKHIRQNSKEYGINLDDLTILGFSAGGHLAGLYSSLYDSKEFSDLIGISLDDMKISQTILAYPAINLTSVYEDVIKQGVEGYVGHMFNNYSEKKDGIKQIHKNMPPVFIFHTLEDEMVDVSGVIDYVSELINHGVETEFHLYSEGKHGLATGDDLTNYGREYPKRVSSWISLSLDWLESLRKKRGVKNV